MRIGMGYDVHRLVANRKLILGGVTVPHEKGLSGHSDADVLVHAVCDALLGAAAMGDIGMHFPDTDPQYQGISSLCLLGRIAEMLKTRKLSVVNIDATVVAEAPQLAPYRKEMAENIAGALKIDPSLVNVKATTTEGLGFTGTGKGMAAMGTVLLNDTRPEKTGMQLTGKSS